MQAEAPTSWTFVSGVDGKPVASIVREMRHELISAARRLSAVEDDHVTNEDTIELRSNILRLLALSEDIAEIMSVPAEVRP